MIALRVRFAVLLFLATLPMGLRGDEPVFREKGAIYLDDLQLKPIKIDVADNAPIYFDADKQR